MIIHITYKESWARAKEKGVYTTKTLQEEGFIHCSREHQVIKVANYMFKGMSGLVLLFIDEDKVHSEVRYEGLNGNGEEYPHIYGPLNLDAVQYICDFIPDEKGCFHLP